MKGSCMYVYKSAYHFVMYPSPDKIILVDILKLDFVV